MMRSTIFLLVCAATLMSLANGLLHCPVLTSQLLSGTVVQKCFDGSSGYFGCYRTGVPCWKSSLGLPCNCDTECKGWAVDLGINSNYNFQSNSFQKDKSVISLHGDDDICLKLREPALSAMAINGSCAILWETAGCYDGHVRIEGGSIVSDVRRSGLSGIHGVSGCHYNPLQSIEVTLYQHNVWSLFGSSETVVIGEGECKLVGDFWKDKISRIKNGNGSCFKIWENGNCTGSSYCHCGRGALQMPKIIMNGSTSWNDRVQSLSMCS